MASVRIEQFSQAADDCLQLMSERRNSIPNDLTSQRAAMDELGAKGRLVEGVSERETTLAGRGALLFTPDCETVGAVLYLHGGGYVMGSPTSHRALAAKLALEASALVYVLDYRLAPEHQAPAAREDAVAAWDELVLLHPQEALGVAGDSAGGGLSLVLLQHLVAHSSPSLPRACALLSPWLDLEVEGYSEAADFKDRVNPPVLRAFGDMYRSNFEPRDPQVSPLYGRMDALPALLIQAGSNELLCRDSERLADKLDSADGLDWTFQLWEGMFHVWQAYWPILPEGEKAIAEIGDFFKKHLSA